MFLRMWNNKEKRQLLFNKAYVNNILPPTHVIMFSTLKEYNQVLLVQQIFRLLFSYILLHTGKHFLLAEYFNLCSTYCRRIT